MNWTTQEGTPFIITFTTTPSPAAFVSWYMQEKSTIEETLKTTGAVLFRNCNITHIDHFNTILEGITGELKSYTDGFSPRTKLKSNIYTSTEYDEDHYITLHNELSYSSNWPDKILFCCIIPPETGGETPIADGREILKSMRPDLLETFKEKGVRYIRNIHGGQGAGPSWQQTFETEDKAAVEHFCRNNDIIYQWNNGMLRLIQNRPATINHPLTGEEVWFNQVDQFHPCHLPQEIYETLMMMYDDVESLPMYGCYGDGTPIPEAHIREVRSLVDQKRILTPWQQGDLLLVDNILVCHGRMPYKGKRQILVAME
ncbi:MAG: TauD/TfdA family dioxygenase [Bacteroidota bacterium]